MKDGTTMMAKWQDWASFVLGMWLAVSPWGLGYTQLEGATANAAFVGLTLALGAHFEATCDLLAAEWLNLAVGVWLVLAPFALGFSTVTHVAANSVVVGAAVALLAISAMSLDKEVARLWRAAYRGSPAYRGVERRAVSR
jgi:hypothetical protein